MRQSSLGTTTLQISRLGFGAWSIGGPAWSYSQGVERDETSLQAMLRAFGLGVNWVDTAPTYGQGHSEELIGRALSRLGSDRPKVFTKCGRHWDSPDASPRSDLRPMSIKADCEASLRRLGVDVIDLLQIHWPDEVTGTPIEESWGQMARLVDEGKIRAAGVSNFDQGLLERCARVAHVDSVQLPLSLITRRSAAGLIQWCAAHEAGVLTYSPMQIGLLTDSFIASQIETMHPDDWRHRHPEFQEPRLSRNLALRDSLRPLARAHNVSVAAIAVAWVLAWPEVSGAIVGARTASQAQEWLQASEITLDSSDLDMMAAAIARTGSGDGPTRPTPPKLS